MPKGWFTICRSVARHDSERQPATINGFVNHFRSVVRVAPCRDAGVAGIESSSIRATVQRQSLGFLTR